jgi:RimJ/RimL family protein N-acetyltransferase
VAKASRSARFTRYHLGQPWCEAIKLEDGRQFIIRPMQPDDAPTLRRSFARLTPDEVRMRFLHPIKELTESYSRKLATIDPDREFALILVESLPPAEALIGAVVRASVDRTGNEAEFAIIVGRELAQNGLGKHLMKKVIEWARKKRLDAIYGLVLHENTAMLKLADRLGFDRYYNDDDNEVALVRLKLS